MKAANKFSDLSIIGVFFITLINVLISTFNGTNLGGGGSSSTTTTASFDGEIATMEAIAPTMVETAEY